MSKFEDVIVKLLNLSDILSSAEAFELSKKLLIQIEADRFPGDTQNGLPRHSVETLQATLQIVNKSSDEKLMKMVLPFFHNSLDNFLEDVPEAEDDSVWKHVQEVTMHMHKQAYKQIWKLVNSQLRSEQVWSVLVKEFFPTIELPVNPTEDDQMEAFEHWFRKVHCSLGEPHPPSDVRTMLSTMNSVLKVKEEVVKELKQSSESIHRKLCENLQQDCLKNLKSNKALNKYIKKEELSDLAFQIIEVVSAMLLHSSPIIPFTGQPFFFATYHDPTRNAREDSQGRSVLVYRTPYVYFYHYGELKTVLKASVTFEIPPDPVKSVPSQLPSTRCMDDNDGKLAEVVITLFTAEMHSHNYSEANRKTKRFVEWYRFANITLTTAMLKRNKVTQAEFYSLISISVKPSKFTRQNHIQVFIAAFKKRYRFLAENPNFCTAICLHNELKDQIQLTNPGMKREELDEAARFLIDLLCYPKPWIPFGVEDEPYFQPLLHEDYSTNHRQLQKVKCYVSPLLWSPATNATLLRAYAASGIPG